jgi:methyl-accepting chemotaxis protein
MHSLSTKIYATLGIVALALLSTTVTLIYLDEQALAKELLQKNLETQALSYFDSVNTMMITGTIADRKIVQDKLLSQDNIIEARIIRSDALRQTFGAGFKDQSPQSEQEKKALSGETLLEEIEGKGQHQISYLTPIIATEDYRGTNCLSCHAVASGTVLGAVKLTYDLAETDERIANSTTKAAIIQLLAIISGFVIISILLKKLVISRLRRLRDTIKSVEDNMDLSKQIEVYSPDELGEVSQALNNMLSTFKNSFKRVSAVTDSLIEETKHVDEISNQTSEAMIQNERGTDSVATAINELDASATEVQNNTKTASEKSEQARENTSKGLQIATQAKEGINELRDKVIENTDMITALSNKTNEVGNVLEVITGIAEQTNLLALNAAIEAARAGEQGRGFAVVADEVRQLATKTQESIDQIQHTISVLQSDASNALHSMTLASEQANEKAEDVNNVASLLVEINEQISELDALNYQIATAAEQQNGAAEEINRNISNISEIASHSRSEAVRGKQVSEKLLELSFELSEQVSFFKLD